MRLLPVGLLALAWAAAPAVAVPTTLFAHFGPPEETFGLSTQEPDAGFVLDEGEGPTVATLSCLPRQPAGGTAQEAHTLHGFILGDAVVYSAEGSRVQIPPLKGTLADMTLLGQPVLHWYWSAETADPPGAPGAPVVVPEVVVQATLFLADSIDLQHMAFEEAEVLAAGESEPALLAGEASQGVEHDVVDGRPVYHFVVPMQAEPRTVLPRVFLPILRVETSVRNDACEDGRLMPGGVRLHSSPGHRPRLDLDVSEPLSLGLPLHAELWESESKPVVRTLVLHAKVVDAWGYYDIARLEATAEGPSVERTVMERLPELQPIPRVYNEGIVAFGIQGGPFEAGTYTFRVSASTLQGANGTWEASFQLGEEPEAPGLGAVAVLAAVAMAAAVRRRR